MAKSFLNNLVNQYDAFVHSLTHEDSGKTRVMPIKYPEDINISTCHLRAIEITNDTEQFRALKKDMKASNMFTSAGISQVLPQLLDKRIKESKKHAHKHRPALQGTNKMRGMIGKANAFFSFRYGITDDDDDDDDESSEIGEKIWERKSSPKRECLSGRRSSIYMPRRVSVSSMPLPASLSHPMTLKKKMMNPPGA